jgi:levoglucosan dehydrogenase
VTLRVGVIGTSWWADSMYLPALGAHDNASVVSVCGRDPDRTTAFAQRWEIPHATTNTAELLDHELDAVIIATPNDSHEELALAALDRQLHVLCEKPLSLTSESASRMAARARETGATTMVPFTYRYMPTNRFVKRLIDDGYLGRPFHLNLRYFTGYAREHGYNWRFDTGQAGSGVLGDLGSHWLDLAEWIFGPITEIGAITERFHDRPNRPDGSPYVRAEDSATMTVRFGSGAHGTLQTSAVCWEGTAFGQTHHLDAHGSEGTLYSVNDWDTVQEVRGVKAGKAGPASRLTIPDEIWDGARRAHVHDTYKDVFRSSKAMIGEFVDAARGGRTCEPNFDDGARIQRLLALAGESASLDGRLLVVDR